MHKSIECGLKLAEKNRRHESKILSAFERKIYSR